MPAMKTFGLRTTDKEMNEFRRNCRWYGEENSSRVIRDLMEAFNRACLRCRAKDEVILGPITLKTGIVREVADDASSHPSTAHTLHTLNSGRDSLDKGEPHQENRRCSSVI